MDIKIGIKKTAKTTTKEELLELTKEELADRLLSLQSHNAQLKNIITQNTKADKPVKIKHLNNSQKAFDFSKHIFRHVLVKFFYHGWDYHGYVVQEDTTNTVEHYLFEALRKTCLIKSRETSNYHRCGRTDKGVSSFSQVISIDLRSKLSYENQGNVHDEINYCQILNRVLPDNIQCIAWMPVISGFSARFDCKNRSYKYYFPKGILDINKMEKGCEYLHGTHDFRNLCKMDVANGVTEFTRTIEEVNIQPLDGNQDKESVYSMYIFNIKSKGFLWHQIRCIMGVLFLIGERKEVPEIINELFDINSNPSKPDYNMASEIPLNLFNCEYAIDQQWIYEPTALQSVINLLQKQWTVSNVKSTMIKTMLIELNQIQSQSPNHLNQFVNALNNDNKTKRHVPLMNRPKCDSLEVKVQHYLKRQKLEIKETPTPIINAPNKTN